MREQNSGLEFIETSRDKNSGPGSGRDDSRKERKGLFKLACNER